MWYNLGESVRYWARYIPANLALWTEKESFTWREFNQRTDELAAGMEKLDVRKGDRVAILADNCSQWCETTIAALKVGAIAVPLNPRLLAKEVEYLIADSGSKLLFCDDRHSQQAEAVKANVENLSVFVFGRPGFDALRIKGEKPTPVEMEKDDLAFICYTSGTTGFPKGAMLSHDGIRCMGLGIAMLNGLNADTRALYPVPLAFTAGVLGSFIGSAVWGGSLYLLERFEPKQCLALIEKEKINYLGGAVIMFEMIAAQPEFEAADVGSLKGALVGASPVPLPLLEKWQAKGVCLRQAYGLTESSSQVISVPAWAAREKIKTIGFSGYSAEFRVVDETGSDCPPGETGEVIVRGPVVMRGYWNNAKATAETIKDGWLYTGDAGVKDEDGFITLVDRMKDMIISGGINTYPAEIEKCIYEIDGVIEVAVIGLPDEKWGETVGAVIRTRSDKTVQNILEHCRRNLADYKIPRYVKLVEEPLPRTMSGKITKGDIREIYTEKLLAMEKVR